MNMIRYRCFGCSEDFEKWQQDNPRAKIYVVTPVVSGVDFDFSADKDAFQKAQGTTNVAAFVTYVIPKDEQQEAP